MKCLIYYYIIHMNNKTGLKLDIKVDYWFIINNDITETHTKQFISDNTSKQPHIGTCYMQYILNSGTSVVLKVGGGLRLSHPFWVKNTVCTVFHYKITIFMLLFLGIPKVGVPGPYPHYAPETSASSYNYAFTTLIIKSDLYIHVAT